MGITAKPHTAAVCLWIPVPRGQILALPLAGGTSVGLHLLTCLEGVTEGSVGHVQLNTANPQCRFALTAARSSLPTGWRSPNFVMARPTVNNFGALPMDVYLQIVFMGYCTTTVLCTL